MPRVPVHKMGFYRRRKNDIYNWLLIQHSDSLLFRYEILTKLLYYKDLFPVLGSPTRKRLNDLE